METKKNYGLQYVNCSCTEEIFQKLARLLFLSQSNSVQDVHNIMQKIKPKKDEELQEYIQFLKDEIDIIRESSKVLKDSQEEICKRLQSWIDTFGCKSEEISEYVSFYDLSTDIITSLRLVQVTDIVSPVSIHKELDKYVIGQDEAKKVLSSAVYIHLLRRLKIKPQICALYKSDYDIVPLLPNSNLILIGSTGTGKSYMLKTIAKLFGLPFLKIDCASLTASGYTGNGLNEYLSAFYKMHNGDKQEISNAIIFFDEFDKLSEQGYARSEGSVGGVEMQQEFLNLIEDKEYLINNRRDKEESILINLSSCMFVFGGSFHGIETQINKRLGQKTIGFKNGTTTEVEDHQLLQNVVHQDIINFGMLPELVGRINHIVTLQNHTRDTIIKIMKNATDSSLKAYQNYFDLHLDKLIIEEDVFELLAERVIATGTGARAVNSILNELLKDLVYEAPNLITETLVIDKGYFKKVFNY